MRGDGDGKGKQEGNAAGITNKEYPSRLSSSDTTVKLPLPHLVAHFVQKKTENFLFEKTKNYLHLFSLQILDNECPPSFRVPSFLIVINESENVSERKRK